MYYVIAYLIGTVKYKNIHVGEYDSRQEVVDVYNNLLDKYIGNKEFSMVLLNNDHQVLTCWALETPVELRTAQTLALDKFKDGEDLYIDPNLKLINIFGSAIFDELKEAASSI